MFQTQAGMTADGTPLGASHTLCLMPGSTLLVELCSPAAVYSWVLCKGLNVYYFIYPHKLPIILIFR